ncbi:SGNH/GDSL hydrolase family protein [Limnospira indica]|uniref:SGNH/GDSL hydrolase family protein n=1 Tax=Limnospira indica TaxID=147322 RepID=UPI0018611C70|nr:hypothetical protein [Limnospira indica]QNH56893.1 MAG: SGNH/GDSL hydrolase family protein [Limnospira indica BM01]
MNQYKLKISQKLPIKAIVNNPVCKFFSQTLIIAGITFLLTEATFRIYHRINPTFVFYNRSYNRWRGRPHAQDFDFQLNSHGFKDVEFTQAKPEGIYRMLGIGDSFAFGIVPYHYNYLTLIEKQLNSQDKNIEVINMGIPGLGPAAYLALLINEGLVLNPDKILLSFYIGNDFIDNHLTSLDRNKHTFYTVAFLQSLIKLQTQFEGTVYNPNNLEYKDDHPTLTDESYLEQVSNLSRMFDIRTRDGIFLGFFEDAMADIRRIKEICDYRNIDLTIVIIPSEVQVNKQLQSQVIDILKPDDPQGLDFDHPNRLLRDRLSQYNINYIDLLDDFRQVSQTTRLYRPNDSHWNIAGNALAAELITKHLLTHHFNSDGD